MRVLFLCTGNSARSQMAEALLRHVSGGRIDVHSAGTFPRAEIHPMAAATMRRGHGLDLVGQFPKSLDRYAGESFDYVITVCDRAAESCPVFPGDPARIHWSFPDPAAATGTDADRQRVFDRTASEIAERVRVWLALPTVQQRATDETGEPTSLGEFRGYEIYPMPMFATLAVADVAGTAHWYEHALGFGTVFGAPVVDGQPSLVHLRRNKYQDLLLVPGAPVGGSAPSSLTLSFHTPDVDALAARARGVAALGVSSIDGPVDTPWNTRDLRVTDPAGHRLIFTSRQANPDLEQAARWKATFETARKS